MESRYSEMIIWGIIYFLFCAFFLIFMKGVKIVIKRIAIRANGKNSGFTFYTPEILCAICLSIISGIRCNCGSDYYNYYLQSINNSNWYESIYSVINSRFQSGMTLLIYLSNSVFKSEYAIFIVSAFVVIIPTFYYICSRSYDIDYSILLWLFLGYFLMSTNILKQAISMTFILFFYDRSYKKDIIGMILFGVGAVFFHTASLYMIFVILFMNHIRFTPSKMLYVSFGSVIVSFLMRPVFSRLVLYLPYQYAKYSSLFSDDRSIDLKLFFGGVLISAFYIFVTWKMLNKEDIFDDYTLRLLNLQVWCIPVLILGFRIYLFNRIAYYGLQFIILLLPIYVKTLTIKTKRWFTLMLVIFCLFFSTLCAENNYYHYGTIFNEKPMSVLEYSIRYQR